MWPVSGSPSRKTAVTSAAQFAGNGIYTSLPSLLGSEIAQRLERERTDRKVRGSNPASESRLPLSRLGQPGSIPALVLPSGGMAARHRKGATAERCDASEAKILQRQVKHSGTRFITSRFEAGNHFRSSSLATFNMGHVLAFSSVDNLVGMFKKRSDVSPIENVEVHASNTEGMRRPKDDQCLLRQHFMLEWEEYF
ncbi:hypothetical protein CSKR_108681 [Clonorchis sinensis]|uniref:Uncharacterized protein n=1 Tax=Clonorchis sinensis TaxID=79923 RepID=A0A3R7GJX0_CLOSI|nr:hypothetical protein CSKR_108681 [Clonorchis sinensis]